MNEWLDLFDGGWWNVAGWTMLHFLWLGTLVGLAAGVCRLLLRRSSANLRYVAALLCLLVLAALPIGIGIWLATNQPALVVDVAETSVLANNGTVLAQLAAPGSAGGIVGTVSADRSAPPTPILAREPAIEAHVSSNPRQSRGLADVFAEVAVYLPWAWLTGTPLTFLLLVTGVVGAERLRRSSRILDDGPIAEACGELARSLRIGGRVTVAVCERIAAPVLIGIVRPMILLPSSALTGWSPEEIEMVLLHELAHVRRWDNLINLLQRFVEAALFFHPAVWLVSRWVRAEREACCDAVVVGRTNRPHAYAEILVALAAQLPRSVLFHPTATSAMAAGPLRGRIRRILSLDDDPMLISGKSLGVVMSGLLLAAMFVVLNLSTRGQAEESTTNDKVRVEQKVVVSEIKTGADSRNPETELLLKEITDLQRTKNELEERLTELTSNFDRAEREMDVQMAGSNKEEKNPALQSLTKEYKIRQSVLQQQISVINKLLTEKSELLRSNSEFLAELNAVDVPFVLGASRFADGDRIAIREIRGTSNLFAPGNTYWIKGTYTLRSRDRASLGASVTARSSTNAITPHDPDQSVGIARGSGEFTLKLPMRGDGWPHVSFYPADGGQSFGGVYFGTGNSVLKEWWKESPKTIDKSGDSRIETEAVRQELVRQVEAMNQLKYLALAMHNYHDAKGTFPANASYDTFDRPLLSWRVHILPYLDDDGANALYNEFRLDEPWDSEHNRALIPRMPAVFQNPNRPAGGFTSYLAAVGSDCVFDGTPKGTSFAQIPDGTANTIMVVEADDAVEWTKPSDLKFNPAMPKVGLGDFRPNGWLAVFADGSVHLVGKDKPARAVRDLFTCGRKAAPLDNSTLDVDAMSTSSLSDAVKEFNVRAQANDTGRYQPVLTEEEVLTAIESFDWDAARIEPRIREIFRKIAEMRTLPDGAKLYFTTRWETDSGSVDVWWINLSVVTGPNQGYTLRIRNVSPPQLAAPNSAKFPSLEEQKLADLAYRRLGIELTPLNDDQLKRVKTLGYDGGLLVTRHGDPVVNWNEIRDGDLLVGLAIWPTTSLQAAGTVLNRDDLADLSPLKFYVVRHASTSEDDGKTYIMKDLVVTGRIHVNLDDERPRATAPPAEQYSVERSNTLTPQQMTALVTPQPAQAQPLEPTSQPDANRGDPQSNPNTEAHSTPTDVPPWMGELKAKLRDREPLGVVFFYVDGSEPCRQVRGLLKQFQRKYVNLPLNVLDVNVEEQRPLAVKYDIERVPALLFFDNDNRVVKKTYGDVTESQFAQYLLEVAERLPAVSPASPEMRYQGKTFEEWRTAWQTELSLEKRLEVVKALAAFGASGRDKEAAEAILNVAQQLDWSFIDPETAASRLKQACVDAFVSGRTTEGYRIPTEAWWPLVVPIYENSADKSTIVTYLAHQLPVGEKSLIPKLLELSNKEEATQNLALAGLKAIDPQLEDDRVVSRLRELLTDANNPPAGLRWAITNLFYNRSSSGGYGPQPELRWVPELQPLLFHPDLEVRQTARYAISKAEPRDAVPLVEYLINIIDTQGDGRDRRDAIRALAALGGRAALAEERLKAIARDPKDNCRIPAAAALLALWPDIANWRTDDMLNKLFGPDAISQGESDDVSRKLKAEQDIVFGIYTQNLGGGGIF